KFTAFPPCRGLTRVSSYAVGLPSCARITLAPGRTQFQSDPPQAKFSPWPNPSRPPDFACDGHRESPPSLPRLQCSEPITAYRQTCSTARSTTWTSKAARSLIGYQTVLFQWSLHAIDGDGVPHHREFLADGGDNPRRRFAETLIEALAAFDAPILTGLRSAAMRQVPIFSWAVTPPC